MAGNPPRIQIRPPDGRVESFKMMLSVPEFDYVRRLVLEQSAIVLRTKTRDTLSNPACYPLARGEGLASINLLVERLQAEPFHGLHRRAVEAMTTNETSFFRDFNPFEAIKKYVLPDLIARRSAERSLSIWCAASSSGQEPYSLSMLIRESFPQLVTWKVHILATDLSTEILARAREGRYSQLEVNRGLPAPLLVKYFQKRGCDWYLRDEIRNMVDYQILNLANAWPTLPPWIS